MKLSSQCFFSGATLPVMYYLNDTNFVLDNSGGVPVCLIGQERFAGWKRALLHHVAPKHNIHTYQCFEVYDELWKGCDKCEVRPLR